MKWADFAFTSTSPKNNRGLNLLNMRAAYVQQTIRNIGKIIEGVMSGSGITAPDSSVETAVQWAIDKAENNYITYSQSNRNLKNPDGTSYDCSSFIITAFYVAGFDIDAYSTSDMIDGFTSVGFEFQYDETWDASALLRGDILIKSGVHTQMYIGNNQDVNCGSTPARVCEHSIDNYGRGWDGILRYYG